MDSIHSGGRNRAISRMVDDQVVRSLKSTPLPPGQEQPDGRKNWTDDLSIPPRCAGE